MAPHKRITPYPPYLIAMMNETLITRFFNDQCTPEEAKLVADYLLQHPELLELYMPEAEFMQFKEEGELPQSVSKQWLKHIHLTTAARRNNTLKWARRLSVAAVCAGLAVSATYFFIHRSPQPIAGIITPEVTSPAKTQIIKENNTGRAITLVLPDGSVVQLMPKASLGYDPAFMIKRDIYLTGEADFTVTPDQQHAFTVHSSEVSTTALGTFFHVKSIPGEDLITVRLNAGKVLVGASLHEQKIMKDVVLNPGKELRFNKRTRAVTVFNFNTTGTDILVKAGSNGTSQMKPDWYKFNNQPVAQVLDQLSDYYGVAIYYHPSDVTQIYFDGKFEKTDSLEKILTDLTLPNNLRFTHTDSGYIIKKK